MIEPVTIAVALSSAIVKSFIHVRGNRTTYESKTLYDIAADLGPTADELDEVVSGLVDSGTLIASRDDNGDARYWLTKAAAARELSVS